MANRIDNKAFQSMLTSSADVTATNLFPKEDTGNKSSEALHSSLMAAGFVPGMGNIADAADAILYAAEGEFGEAAWSAGAMLPFIGQAVSAKKAVKAAKEAGEEVVTIYRGTNWHPSKLKTEEGIKATGKSMIKDGKFVGGRYSQFNPQSGRYDLPEGTIWGSNSAKEAAHWLISEGQYYHRKKGIKPYMLKFEIPKKELNKLNPLIHNNPGFPDLDANQGKALNFAIPKGLHKRWLTEAKEVSDDMLEDIYYYGRYRLDGKPH